MLPVSIIVVLHRCGSARAMKVQAYEVSRATYTRLSVLTSLLLAFLWRVWPELNTKIGTFRDSGDQIGAQTPHCAR